MKKKAALIAFSFWAGWFLHPQPLSAQVGLSGALEGRQETRFYKEPSRAFLLAFFPGILIHGYGHFYAKDKLTGTALLTGEILSLAAIGVGAAMDSSPSSFSGGIFGNDTQTARAGRDMVVAGAILFAVTWIADMVHAPTAAHAYNKEYNLSPVVWTDGAVGLAWRF